MTLNFMHCNTNLGVLDYYVTTQTQRGYIIVKGKENYLNFLKRNLNSLLCICTHTYVCMYMYLASFMLISLNKVQANAFRSHLMESTHVCSSLTIITADLGMPQSFGLWYSQTHPLEFCRYPGQLQVPWDPTRKCRTLTKPQGSQQKPNVSKEQDKEGLEAVDIKTKFICRSFRFHLFPLNFFLNFISLGLRV